ncbi:hypothetical protein [Haladaptatus sp. CMAA 1911]|uniref:hypothetical protein n=1 Tax=unclassified Haladaptatus TaxID=2622732 RepID=UPI003754B9DA
MARPNVDVSHLVIGAVKDYADKHDISRSEAHEELLRSALINAELLDGEDPVRKPTDE